MKLLTILLQTVSLLILPSQARADETTEQLKKTYEYLKGTYPGYLDNLYRAQVFTHYSWRYQDYLAVLEGLSAQSTEAWQRVQSIHEHWNNLFSSASSGGSAAIEAAALDLGEALSAVELESRKLAVISSDQRILSNAWASRCSPQRMSHVRAVFDPLNMFSVNRLDLKAPGSNFTIGFQVASDFSGNLAPPGFFSPGEDGMIITTATAIGAYIGSIVPVIGNVIGGAIGAVVGAVIVVIKNIFSWHGEYEAQQEYITKIRQVQESKITALASDAHGILEGLCSELLAEAVKDARGNSHKVSEIMANNAKRVSEMATHSAKVASEMRLDLMHLEARLKRQLATVIRAKLLRAREAFLSNIEEIDSELEQADLGLRRALPGMMKLVTRKRGASSPLVRAGTDQELWDQLIEAEARYAPTVTFSDYTVWGSTQEFIRKEVAK